MTYQHGLSQQPRLGREQELFRDLHWAADDAGSYGE
jgi:hypothetical protein